MKLRFMVLSLVSIFFHSEFFAMEHVKKNKPQKLPLSEIVVENSNSSQDENTIQLLYEALLEKKMSKKSNTDRSINSPRQVIQPIKSQLCSRIEAFKDTDPDLYKVIMDFKKNAEGNGRTPQEIEAFIKENLDQLPVPVQKNMYKDLYHAHVEKVEAVKKKDYELHEVLDSDEPVDLAALYHAILYRSSSMQGGINEVKKEVDKSKKCFDGWLEKVKKEDPNAYAILVQAYEQLKDKNQQNAVPDLLNAVDQISNVEPLQILMKKVQAKLEAEQAAAGAWSNAWKIIGGIVVAGLTAVGSVGGTLGGLFGASKVPITMCTLAKCLVLMNVTIPG